MSNSKDNKTDIPALLAFVRKHQVYKSSEYLKTKAEEETITEWMKEENIQEGEHPIEGYVLYGEYTKWAKDKKGYDKEKTCVAKRFHSIMRDTLNHYYRGTKNVKYTISRKIVYAPKKRQKRSGAKENKED